MVLHAERQRSPTTSSPSHTPSLRLTWVIRRLLPSAIESASTAKLWFWLVISIRPVPTLLHRVVAAVVAERQLHRVRAERPPEQLVAEADPEHRDVAEQLGDRLDRAYCTIAGSPGPF